MSKNEADKVREVRKARRNPYAFLNGEGSYEVVFVSSDHKHCSGSASESLHHRRKLLDNPYAYLNGFGAYDVTNEMSVMNADRSVAVNLGEDAGNSPQSHIERIVRELHGNIWKKRGELWPSGVPADPVDLLDPSVALELLGYRFDMDEYLGEFTDRKGKSEVAGILDRHSRKVKVSRRLPRNTRRFTAAHELGHVVLHEGMTMHRDRPIDGTKNERGSRDKVECEADKFASLFLMPEKLVKARFTGVFGVNAFVLSEDALFAFGQSDIRDSVEKCSSVRDLARSLAKTERYNGRHMRSLADQFGVSVEAMAIRLEELGLVAF
jgi:hypothetical protein